jgi:glycosyltransferase involved in cell wall biosynthesis
MRVAVVTPTIGSEHLEQCIQSVRNQTYENLTHYIFLDGEQYYDSIHRTLYKFSNNDKLKTVTLQENVGKGWYGHRVYAACSFLVNADIICYLDQDNWYDEDHVEKIVKKIESGYDWCFSLRKIYDRGANFLFKDNCESLGKWPVYFNDSVFHIDTSCFGVKRSVAVAIGHSWYGQWGADRQFFGAIKKHFNNFSCTGSYSCNYRLDGNENSVTKEFFEKGNTINNEKYRSEFPWLKSDVEIIGPGISIIK